jgi:fructuronate reductase
MSSGIPLCAHNLSHASSDLEQLKYDRESVKIGVAHFGPGAFHRAHQAYYFNKLLETDLRWGISEISLNSQSTFLALKDQDYLYALCEEDSDRKITLIGAIQEMLFAPTEKDQVLERLSNPETHIVTSTITEKGYHLKPDGELDLSHPLIVHDLNNFGSPKTFIGWLYLGLLKRHQDGLDPFTVIPCDNLPSNGKLIKQALLKYAETLGSPLLTWIADNVTVLNTMVDSITPATDEHLKHYVEAKCGLYDKWPIQRENFTQWVIEHSTRGVLPDWESVGVQTTSTVATFEQSKLRLLNGAHSFLAYAGLAFGYESVYQAMGDSTLVTAVNGLWKEIKPLLPASDDLNLDEYTDALLVRFTNPVLVHKLNQIAGDGTQKLAVRLLPSLTEAIDGNKNCHFLSFAIAFWIYHVKRSVTQGKPINDPKERELVALTQSIDGNDQWLDQCVDDYYIFPSTLLTAKVRSAIVDALGQIELHGPKDALKAICKN